MGMTLKTTPKLLLWHLVKTHKGIVMCFVSCKKKKKLSSQEKKQKKIDNQKALARMYLEIMDKPSRYMSK